jgi:hypothetical protein
MGMMLQESTYNVTLNKFLISYFLCDVCSDYLSSENVQLPHNSGSNTVPTPSFSTSFTGRNRTTTVSGRSRSSTKFTTASSVRNFKSVIFSSTKSGLTLSADDNTTTQSRQSHASSNESDSGQVIRQRRMSTSSGLSNNHQLRKMSCAAIALSASNTSTSSMDATPAAPVMSPAQLFRRHSAIKRAERAKEQNCESDSECDGSVGHGAVSSPKTTSDTAARTHARKMRRLSMVLQAPQGGSPQDKSQNSIGSCSDFSGRVGRRGSSTSCSSAEGGSVVSVLAMQQEDFSSEDDEDDAFDSEISDNEVSNLITRICCVMCTATLKHY